MPKSTHKDTSKKPIMLRLFSWRKEWWHWLKSRAAQQALQFPFYPAVSSIVTSILVAILYILSRQHTVSGNFTDLAEGVTITMFIVAIILFALSFVWILISSFHPLTRKWADKHFGFRDRTETEELKERIENGLRSTNERIDKELEVINSRLGNIEATLKALVSKESKE